jgi:hypothetical protein
MALERIPEIHRLPQLAGQVKNEKDWRLIVQMVMDHHRNRDNFDEGKLGTLRQTLQIGEEAFAGIYTGLYILITQLIRNHTRPSQTKLSEIVSQEVIPIGLPAKYGDLVGSAFVK